MQADSKVTKAHVSGLKSHLKSCELTQKSLKLMWANSKVTKAYASQLKSH